MVKVLAFERGGYCNWSKRLKLGQFAPAVSAGVAAAALSATEIAVRGRRKRRDVHRSVSFQFVTVPLEELPWSGIPFFGRFGRPGPSPSLTG